MIVGLCSTTFGVGVEVACNGTDCDVGVAVMVGVEVEIGADGLEVWLSNQIPQKRRPRIIIIKYQ